MRFRSFYWIMSLLLVILLSVPAKASDYSISIAADSSSGTYHKLLTDIKAVCGNNINIIEAPGVTGGAPGNLDALINNRAQAAWMHTDVFLAQSMADSSYKNYQTLVAMYPEPVHILALKNAKQGNIIQHPTFNSLVDMSGYTIGAAGGGVFTAKIFQGMGQGGFKVNDYDSGDQVIAALNSGEIAGAIFVGAAPLPNISRLDKTQYKLLPVGDAIANRLNTVYRQATISYPGLTQGPIHTLAPLSVIMSRKYNTGDHVAAQKAFRNCFNQQLPRLKDDYSPNWQQVAPNEHGVLDWLSL